MSAFSSKCVFEIHKHLHFSSVTQPGWHRGGNLQWSSKDFREQSLDLTAGAKTQTQISSPFLWALIRWGGHFLCCCSLWRMNLASNAIRGYRWERRGAHDNFQSTRQGSCVEWVKPWSRWWAWCGSWRRMRCCFGWKMLVTGMTIVQTGNTEALQGWKRLTSFLTRNNTWHTLGLQ